MSNKRSIISILLILIVFTTLILVRENNYSKDEVLILNLEEYSFDNVVVLKLEESVDYETEENSIIKNRVATSNLNYSEKDVYWMSKIIHAEARGEDDHGKRLVGEVVLNRVNSPLFPNDVKEVIFERDGLEFEPVYSGTINLEPSDDSIRIAKEVLKNGPVNIDSNILYFNSTSLGKTKINTKWWNGVYTDFVYEGHVFARLDK